MSPRHPGRKNSEKAFTEGIHVLPARGFRVVLSLLARTLGLEKKAFCSSRPSVLTRPRPTSDMPIMRLSRLETAGRLPKRTGSTMPPWGRLRN
jgi:hypothetical protein